MLVAGKVKAFGPLDIYRRGAETQRRRDLLRSEIIISRSSVANLEICENLRVLNLLNLQEMY